MPILKLAYEQSLDPYHGWMAKQLFGVWYYSIAHKLTIKAYKIAITSFAVIVTYGTISDVHFADSGKRRSR